MNIANKGVEFFVEALNMLYYTPRHYGSSVVRSVHVYIVPSLSVALASSSSWSSSNAHGLQYGSMSLVQSLSGNPPVFFPVIAFVSAAFPVMEFPWICVSTASLDTPRFHLSWSINHLDLTVTGSMSSPEATVQQHWQTGCDSLWHTNSQT